MSGGAKPIKGAGIDIPILVPQENVELFGWVALVEGYALPNFAGCHALVALRDLKGKTVGVVTSEQRLQSLLEAALATGYQIAFRGHQIPFERFSPRGGTSTLDWYAIDGVILYNFK